MTSGAPWSVKGIDPKAREVAKDLARRSGMTLGEWLNRMILEDETPEEVTSEAHFAPRPMRAYLETARPGGGAPARLEAAEHPSEERTRLSAAFDRLSGRLETSELRTGQAIENVERSVRGAVARIEAAERDQVAVAARFEALAGEIQSGQETLDERLRRLEQHEAEAGSAQALHALEDAVGKVAQHLYQGEERTRRELEALDNRLAATEAARPAEDFGASLTRRLGEAEARTADALDRLRVSFAALDDRLARVEVEGAPALERRLEAMADDLAKRVEAARGEVAEQLRQSAEQRFGRMEARLADMTEHVRSAEARSVRAVEGIGREVLAMADVLNRRVQKAEERSAQATDKVGADVARIAETVDVRLTQADAAHAQALEKLGAEITRITERLGERISAAERRSAQAIDEVSDQVVRATDKAAQRQDRAAEDLAERIRQSEQRTQRLLDEARTRIDDRLAEVQRQAAVAAAAPPSYGSYAREGYPAHTPVIGPAEPDGLADAAGLGGAVAPFTAERLERVVFPRTDVAQAPKGFASNPHDDFDAEDFDLVDEFVADEASAGPKAVREEGFAQAGDDDWARAPDLAETSPEEASDPDPEPELELSAPAAAEVAEPAPEPQLESAAQILAGFEEQASKPADELEATEPAPSLETTAPVDEDLDAPPPLERPLSTREVIEQARAAARASAQGGERRREKAAGAPSAASQAAEAASSMFSGLGALGRPRKGRTSTLQTALLVAGGAAFLSVGAAGFVLMEGSPKGAAPKRVVDASAPDPQVATAETDGSDPFGPNPRAAVAVAPREIAAETPAPTGEDLAALYAEAVRAIEQNAPGGLEPLRKSANLGHAPAQLYLAKLYEDGRAGVKRDPAEAWRWTERAASGGDRKAMHNLALYYFEGSGGGVKNAALAAQWFRKAADLGLIDSQYNLGRLYEEGVGVSQNGAEAYKWYLIAARAGDQESRNSAQRVRQKLSSEARSVAERAALGFRPALAGAPMLASAEGSSAAAMTAQRALSRLGYYQGPRDGVSSPALKMAIAAYQRDQGFVATGALDEVTIARLSAFTR